MDEFENSIITNVLVNISGDLILELKKENEVATIQLFIDNNCREAWRFFKTGVEGEHVVVTGDMNLSSD